jgi:hypothetical protein
MMRTAVLVLATLIAPTAAPAPTALFGAPTTIATFAYSSASHTAVAVDGQGVVHVVWVERRPPQDTGDNALMYAEHRPGQPWTAPIPLAPADPAARDPAIATNAAGDLAVAWVSDGIVLRRRTAEGVWGVGEVVSPPGEAGDTPQVVLNNRADLVVGWQHVDPPTGPRHALVRVRLAGQPWAEAHDLWPSEDAEEMRVALDSAGAVTAVWIGRQPPHNNSRVLVATLPPGGSWTSATRLASAIHPNDEPQLALRGGTTPWVVWRHLISGQPYLLERHRTPTGWSKAIRLNPQGGFVAGIRVDSNVSGQLIVTWATGHRMIRSRFLTKAGHWQALTQVTSRRTTEAELIDVQLTAAGRAIVLWRQSRAVFAAGFRPATNRWVAVQRLDTADPSPALAMNSKGVAAVSWRKFVDPASVRVALGQG